MAAFRCANSLEEHQEHHAFGSTLDAIAQRCWTFYEIQTTFHSFLLLPIVLWRRDAWADWYNFFYVQPSARQSFCNQAIDMWASADTSHLIYDCKWTSNGCVMLIRLAVSGAFIANPDKNVFMPLVSELRYDLNPNKSDVFANRKRRLSLARMCRCTRKRRMLIAEIDAI